MKGFAAGAAVAITLFGTGPYLVGTLRGRIRPHAVTWFIWAVTTLIAFGGQLKGGGGWGAAAAGVSAGVGIVICSVAFRRGDRAYTRLDGLCLLGALIALLGWTFAGGPLVAVILIALVDVIGAVPTLCKSFTTPSEEGVSPFVLANAKWLLTLGALDHLNLMTLLFPATTTTVNTAIIGMVLIRRVQLRERNVEHAARGVPAIG